MRVDFVTKEYPPNIYGGAGVHVTELVGELRKLISVNVHAFGEVVSEPATSGYPTPHEFQSANAALQTMAIDLSIVPAIAGADLVHSHTWYANFAGQLAGIMHQLPHVMTAHSLEPLRPWKAEQLGGGYRVSSHIERSAIMSAARVIAVSHAMKHDITLAYPELDPERIDVVHNGIDTEKWYPVREPDTLRELGVDPDARSVVFVGRITQQKGLPYLLEAANELPADVQLVLAAGAPDTPQIAARVEHQVAQLQQRRGNVVWIREHLPQPKLRALLSQATLFACPSIYEPLGIVNLEAMACGATVVATSTGGIPEVVQALETGWLVPIEQMTDGSGTPLDEQRFVADWAQTMNEALASDELSRMSANSVKRAREFSWQTIATRTLEVYQRALAN